MDLNSLIETAQSSESDDRIAELRELIQTALDNGEITAEQLDELEQSAVAKFQDDYAEGKYDPAQVPIMEATAEVTDAARAEIAERERAQQEMDQKVHSLAERMNSEKSADTSDDEEDEDEDSAKSESETAASGESSPAAQQTTPEPASSEAAQPAKESEPVTASAPRRRTPTTPRVNRTPSSRDLNSQRPAQKLPDSNGQVQQYTIAAAADVPDVPTGQTMNMRSLAEATLARFRSMPIGQPGVGEMRKSVAVVNKGYPENLTASGNPGTHSDVDIVEHVADETRLPGGSLIAAAQQAEKNVTAAMDPLPTPPGDIWCAPSQRDYSLCPPLATRSGILDLPSMAMPSMGGIQWPVWYQFPDMHRPPESNQPDAEEEGRNAWHGYVHMYDPDLMDPDYFRKNPKKCIEGPCPQWQEERMNLAYLCVQGDILREYVWPQLAERFISDVMTSHAHYMNEVYIQYIMGHSDTLPAFNAGDTAGQNEINGFGIGSAAEAVIERVGFLVTWFRTTYRMGFQETLEGFAPYWFLNFLKIDIERKSNRPHGSVSTAEVNAIFAQWNTRIQWVYDHPQDLDEGNQWTGSYTGGVMPGTGAAANWPDRVTLTLYPAGSWVLAEDNIVRMDALYDSEKLSTNTYTALFTEDAWLLMNRCDRSFNIPLTNLCLNGAVGPLRDACPPGSEPEPAVAAASSPKPAESSSSRASSNKQQ